MKVFQKLLTLLMVGSALFFFQGCAKQQPESDLMQTYSIEDFNTAFLDGKIANTKENPATVIIVDEHNNILTNEIYKSMDPAEVEEKYDILMVSLSDYKAATEDAFATEEYLKVIPFGPELNMFIHDPYADNEKRMTHDELKEMHNEYAQQQSGALGFRGSDDRVVCDNGANVCTGDIFFQWGNWWDNIYLCAGDQNGSSAPGHISIVEQGCQNQPKLNDFHIFEAWYSFNSDGSINRRDVRHVKASTTWGPVANEICTNFWHNLYLDNNPEHRGTMMSFNSNEHGKKYGFDYKHYTGRPDTYYCSLYAWEMYQEAPGWFIDHDGGLVVDPNDVGAFMYNHSTMSSSAPAIYFEHCDF